MMLNSSKERPLPTRSSSLRSHSTTSNQASETAVSGTGDAKTPELAIELQHLHELKRQVAAQEQKLVALRSEGATGNSSAAYDAAESEASKSLVFTKEKELALALMKVAELTRQLDQLRGCGGCTTRRSMIESPTTSASAAAHKPIVKPTVAPPPPPVPTVTTKLASSSDSHDSCVAASPINVALSSSVAASSPSLRSKSPKRGQDEKNGSKNNNNIHHNNNNENNTPYAKLVQTVAALARTNRRPDQQTTPKRSESFHRFSGEHKLNGLERSLKKSDVVVIRASTSNSTANAGAETRQNVDDVTPVGCFGLESCVNKSNAKILLQQQQQQQQEEGIDTVDSRQPIELSQSTDVTDVPTNLELGVNPELRCDYGSVGKMNDSSPTVRRISSTAQMMSCFAPRPYGMTSASVAANRYSLSEGVTSCNSRMNGSSPSAEKIQSADASAKHSALNCGLGLGTTGSNRVVANHVLINSLTRESDCRPTTVVDVKNSNTGAANNRTSSSSNSLVIGATATSSASVAAARALIGGSSAAPVSKTSSTLTTTVAGSTKTSAVISVSRTMAQCTGSAVTASAVASTSVGVQRAAAVPIGKSMNVPVVVSSGKIVAEPCLSGSKIVNASNVVPVTRTSSMTSTCRTTVTSVNNAMPVDTVAKLSTTKTGASGKTTENGVFAGDKSSGGNQSKRLVVYSTTRAVSTTPSATTSTVTMATAGKLETVPNDIHALCSVTSTTSVANAAPLTSATVSSANELRNEVTGVPKPSVAIKFTETPSSSSTQVPTLSKTSVAVSSSSEQKFTAVSTPAVSVSCADTIKTSSKTSEPAPSEKHVDTSSDSVSTALSVLLNLANSMPTTSASTSGDSPSSPKSSYRYGSRGTVSGIYRRKLGLSTLDQYSRNIDQLYGGGGVDFFGTMSASVDSIASPTSSRPVSIVSPSMSSSLALSSPTVSFGETSPDAQTALQKKALMRPTAPPPPPPSADLGILPPAVPGLQPLESGSGIFAALDGVETISRPRSTAPSIARRAFLYGDVSSPTGDEFKLFEDTSGDGSTGTGGESRPPEASKPSQAGYDPSPSLSTLYIDDEEWHGNLRRGVACTRQSSSRLRGKRKSEKQTKSVTFDPCSLLLSASVTGELDVINASASKVLAMEDSGDIGISAFRNAITNRQYDVIRSLVNLGFDVNAAGYDGWTVLHYAASANDVEMVRLLVVNGACVLAKTASDHETAEMKCNRTTPGFEECSRYLREIATKLGVDNDGMVYAASGFTASSGDELTFSKGARLKILRKANSNEFEWWWASCDGREGYVPQYLLAMFQPARQNRPTSTAT